MDIDKLIKEVIKNNLNNAVIRITHCGKGASGAVYRVECDGAPKTIAVKISEHPVLMLQEYEMLVFLKEKTASKIPDVYFYTEKDAFGIIAMEFIDGVSGSDKLLKYRFNKKHLAESIVENLLVIQKAKNDKFGPYNNAVYDTWQEYYKEFSDEIYAFSRSKFEKGELENIVMDAVELSHKNFYKIFSEEKLEPTLIHGDYWMPNFIIDKNKMELLSVVDPFNVMWADPEYELFAMTVGLGKKLRLYEIYKSKISVSEYCDMKIELYALYSELLWYKKLGSISHSYLKLRSKGLIKEMKKNGII